MKELIIAGIVIILIVASLIWCISIDLHPKKSLSCIRTNHGLTLICDDSGNKIIAEVRK